ncbi:hypothetical protein [Deinococcus petrolearius]|uniref:Uncharacterized protein n=1 Tax=Deinococcus petrolearius TaxID=1751295 RepID=A0ABW1DLW5_9DEIO
MSQETLRIWARAFRAFTLISLGFTVFGLLIYSGNWFVSRDDLSMTPSSFIWPIALNLTLGAVAWWLHRTSQRAP